MDPVNSATVVVTWVHRNGRSVSPHRGVAEQLDEPVLLLGRVAAALRLDADLRLEHHRVHGRFRGLRRPQAEQQRRDGGVGVGLGVDDLSRGSCGDPGGTMWDRS